MKSGKDIEMGDTCERGSQLHPHIVWFGEMVPAMDDAVEFVAEPALEIIAKPTTVGVPEVVAEFLAA